MNSCARYKKKATDKQGRGGSHLFSFHMTSVATLLDSSVFFLVTQSMTLNLLYNCTSDSRRPHSNPDQDQKLALIFEEDILSAWTCRHLTVPILCCSQWLLSAADQDEAVDM